MFRYLRKPPIQRHFSRSEIEEIIWELVSDILGVSGEPQLTASLHDLGANSLDVVDIEMAIEKKLSIDLPENNNENSVSSNSTIDQLIEIVCICPEKRN